MAHQNDDTVFQRDGKFWFIDETGDDHGPFDSATKAVRRYSDYCRVVLGTGSYPYMNLALQFELPYDLVLRFSDYVQAMMRIPSDPWPSREEVEARLSVWERAAYLEAQGRLDRVRFRQFFEAVCYRMFCDPYAPLFSRAGEYRP